MLKINDIVECINPTKGHPDPNYMIQKGKIYTVKSVRIERMAIFVKLKEKGDYEYYQHRFNLIEEEEN